MTGAEAQSEVQLQPPGAGLPFVELWFSRVVFHTGRRVTSRTRADAWFAAEATRIAALARSVDATRLNQPVLVHRVLGIEDSSRNWSVLMLLDHLVIVNAAVADIIEHLVGGRPFGVKISTAAVKPARKQDADGLDRFTQSVETYRARVRAQADLHTRLKHAHPWFGALDAHGWHCLAAAHHTIHRRQMERIVAGESRGSRGSTVECRPPKTESRVEGRRSTAR